MSLNKIDLYRLLWAIFIAEGDVRSRVPFGYIRLERGWKSGKVSFKRVLLAVANELQLEFNRWSASIRDGSFKGDFISWLARKGYNANPDEWALWEKNVRSLLKMLP